MATWYFGTHIHRRSDRKEQVRIISEQPKVWRPVLPFEAPLLSLFTGWETLGEEVTSLAHYHHAGKNISPSSELVEKTVTLPIPPVCPQCPRTEDPLLSQQTSIFDIVWYDFKIVPAFYFCSKLYFVKLHCFNIITWKCIGMCQLIWLLKLGPQADLPKCWTVYIDLMFPILV